MQIDRGEGEDGFESTNGEGRSGRGCKWKGTVLEDGLAFRVVEPRGGTLNTREYTYTWVMYSFQYM